MARILVVYGSTYGQTGKIVRRIDRELVRRGHEVSVYQGGQLPPELNLGSHDAFLVAASVIAESISATSVSSCAGTPIN
jgi:menaquinone-dependent protoporphyrinogen oxidase